MQIDTLNQNSFREVLIASYLFKDKRVAITGGTGFIGSHLISKISSHRPEAIRVISYGSRDLKIDKTTENIDVRIHKNSTEFIRNIISFRPDYIFILGGNSDPRLSVANPRLDLDFNLLNHFRLFIKLSKLRRRPSIIFASSVAVYASSPDPLVEDKSLTLPQSPYGIDKLATEGYLRFFSQQGDLRAFSVRLSATYGPGLKKQVVYDFIRRLIQDPHVLKIIGDGTEVRDLCYVDDQVDGLILLAKKAAYRGEIYNLGSGIGISVKDLAAAIAALLGIKPKISLELEKREKHHGQNWVLNIEKAKLLGHKPKVSLDEGLIKTIDWIRHNV